MEGTALGSIVLLSGPVGAGKTTIAAALVEISPAPLACIEGDRFWPFFAKPARHQTKPELFRISMRAMTLAALPFAREGYEAIVDFSIPPWFLPIARAIAATRDGVPLHYVLLRPSEPVCAARAAARTEGAIADYSTYQDFYKTFAGADANVISDDASPTELVAARIRSGLDAGTFRL
jgi:hypothetical protein